MNPGDRRARLRGRPRTRSALGPAPTPKQPCRDGTEGREPAEAHPTRSREQVDFDVEGVARSPPRLERQVAELELRAVAPAWELRDESRGAPLDPADADGLSEQARFDRAAGHRADGRA